MKDVMLDCIYIFYNYIVTNIPFWTIRKLFYRCGGMKIGKNSRILMKTVVIKPWKISIGERSYINEHCHLDGRGGIEIGDDTSISIYSVIVSGSHNSITFEYEEHPVKIGNRVWAGARTTILPGATIEDKVLIGAGSTLPKGTYKIDSLYSGVPAKYIRRRNAEDYYQGTWKPWFR